LHHLTFFHSFFDHFESVFSATIKILMTLSLTCLVIRAPFNYAIASIFKVFKFSFKYQKSSQHSP